MYSIKDRLWFTYANLVATIAHGGQKRKWSNEPYINHPRRVAEQLKKIQAPPLAVVVALLHDVIEDTRLNYRWLTILMGREVAYHVYKLSYIAERFPKDLTKRKDKKEWYFEQITDMFLWDSAYNRRYWFYWCSILVKWFDMLDNQPSIKENDPNFYNNVWLKEFELFKSKASYYLVLWKLIPEE